MSTAGQVKQKHLLNRAQTTDKQQLGAGVHAVHRAVEIAFANRPHIRSCQRHLLYNRVSIHESINRNRGLLSSDGTHLNAPVVTVGDEQVARGGRKARLDWETEQPRLGAPATERGLEFATRQVVHCDLVLVPITHHHQRAVSADGEPTVSPTVLQRKRGDVRAYNGGPSLRKGTPFVLEAVK